MSESSNYESLPSEQWNLNHLSQVIRKTAIEHGWEDTTRSFGEEIALWHSEASEAFEEFRNGKSEQEVYYSYPIEPEQLGKPEGIPVEAADIIIRILHWAPKRGVDIQSVVLEKMKYNESRSYRHGGKIL